jgi:hypothetical protein
MFNYIYKHKKFILTIIGLILTIVSVILASISLTKSKISIRKANESEDTSEIALIKAQNVEKKVF